MAERGRRVAVLGLPYFGRRLAGELSGLGWRAHYLPHPGRNLAGWARVAAAVARAEVVYLIGSRFERWSPQDLLLRVRRRPVVIHWVGTDVQLAVEAHRRRRGSTAIAERAVHWCDAPWLVEELRLAGVRAEYVPLPIPLEEGQPPPLPERFTALLYYPVDAFAREVFDWETMRRLVEAFPGVRFLLVPSPPETLPGPLPANLEARGWAEDMEALYREVTVLIRLTTHDGQSFMAAEAVSRGRYVIWTHPMPGAVQASGFEAVAAELARLVERHAAGSLGPNLDGRSAVLERWGRGAPLREIDARLRVLTGG
ncbi:hypothetical protein [Tepidiforma sp.]|uniref:hypothetical protein n=1 Tax=Tepidiforma sp. TaxID=2682230 RepID=UPI002ADE704A|nr:hypothetical protein [Tepidiforma sp.]